MVKILLFTIGSLLILSACGSGDYSTSVKAMQRKDKRLSCKEILLEMNEAEHYRKMAHKNKGPKLKNVLMPLGYVSTYMNAEEAIGASEARVGYLDQIYEIMRCDEKELMEERQNTPYQQPQYYAPEPQGAAPAGSLPYYR